VSPDSVVEMYASAAKLRFGLAIKLTYDLWHWRPLQRCPLIRWILVPTFIEYVRLVQRYRVTRNRCERTDRRTDGRTDGPDILAKTLYLLPPIVGSGGIHILQDWAPETPSP